MIPRSHVPAARQTVTRPTLRRVSAHHSTRRRGGRAGAALRHIRSSSASDAASHPEGMGENRRRSPMHSKASHPPSSPPVSRMRGNWSGRPWRRSGGRRCSSTGGSTSGSSVGRKRRALPVRRSAHCGTTAHTCQWTPLASVKARCAMRQSRQVRGSVYRRRGVPSVIEASDRRCEASRSSSMRWSSG